MAVEQPVFWCSSLAVVKTVGSDRLCRLRSVQQPLKDSFSRCLKCLPEQLGYGYYNLT